MTCMTSPLPLKLGGFMTLSSVTVGNNQSESDVCDDVDPEEPEFDVDFSIEIMLNSKTTVIICRI